jgi:hypothetical protein
MRPRILGKLVLARSSEARLRRILFSVDKRLTWMSPFQRCALSGSFPVNAIRKLGCRKPTYHSPVAPMRESRRDRSAEPCSPGNTCWMRLLMPVGDPALRQVIW